MSVASADIFSLFSFPPSFLSLSFSFFVQNLSQFDFDNKYGRKALRTLVDHIWKATSALNDDALEQLQAAGQSVLPEDEGEKEELKRLEDDLVQNPPSREQLLTHSPWIPHPQPWSVHNAACWRKVRVSRYLCAF